MSMVYFRDNGCGPLSLNMVMRARIQLIISKVNIVTNIVIIIICKVNNKLAKLGRHASNSFGPNSQFLDPHYVSQGT